MPCQCCEELMVLEQYDDLELGSAGFEVYAWRCLNCGAIVDSVIAAPHQPANKTEPDPLGRQQLEETHDGDIRDSLPFTAAQNDAARHAQLNYSRRVHHETRK
jgi:hypothetical protein